VLCIDINGIDIVHQAVPGKERLEIRLIQQLVHEFVNMSHNAF
jgi:hypothetical protein